MTISTSETAPDTQGAGPRASAQTVGWALTALTCLVLVVGVVIIRQASSEWRRAAPEPYTPSPSLPVEHGLSEANREQSAGNAPLVLQPIQPDAEEDSQPWDSSKTARDREEETTLR